MENLSPDDPCARAWAAGVFDGEGSATVHLAKSRNRPQAQLFVYQAGREEAPILLERFRQVVECGTVIGPYRGRLWCWRTGGASAVANVATSLWPWLGLAKRQQFLGIADRVPLLWFLRTVGEIWAATEGVGASRADVVDLAWAAGFFVGEGHFGISQQGQLRAEISQASAAGASDVLLRFQRAVMGVGAIRGPIPPSNPWSRLPQYRWYAGSYEDVQAVVALLWRWLDPRKREQARRALIASRDRFRARRSSRPGSTSRGIGDIEHRGRPRLQA